MDNQPRSPALGHAGHTDEESPTQEEIRLMRERDKLTVDHAHCPQYPCKHCTGDTE